MRAADDPFLFNRHSVAWYRQHYLTNPGDAAHPLASPLRAESLAGLLFICLAETPAQGFDELRAAMERYIAPHNIANTKVAFQKDIIEHGNWKLTMENNRECYHCLANHPELTVSLSVQAG